MSNPISTLPNADLETESTDLAEEERPELEVDETLGDEPPALEIDEEPTPDAAAAEPTESRGRNGLILLVLAGLLLGSVAINLKQSRDVAGLEARSSEYQQALAAAVERIDGEAARADSAEAALDRVDNAVDVVNERVLGLQEALDGLREATLR